MWYAILAVLALALVIKFWPIALALALIAVSIPLVRHIRKERYFSSEEFTAHLSAIRSIVSEHNEIVKYTSEIRASGSFEIGRSSTGVHAHLASFENTSLHNYRRDRNTANFQASNVHNCSLQVVRNAKEDPIKYLVKYFSIPATEAGLADVEELGRSISRLEDAVENLHQREVGITDSISPPAFIRRRYSAEFMRRVGVELSPVTVPYPKYVFEYVSAGGNSSQRATVMLNTPTIDALIGVLSGKIRFRKSIAGQRALMTARLREEIKARDRYACKICAVSVAKEPHLLLEVDHIVPVSKGGMSTRENLQTLCWRCNRSKSNKLPGT